MTATYELIDGTVESSEKMHEIMVDAARRLRQHEQELRQFESQAAVLPEGTPERQKLDYLIQSTRRQIDTDHFLVNTGRKVLNCNKTLIDHLNGEG